MVSVELKMCVFGGLDKLVYLCQKLLNELFVCSQYVGVHLSGPNI